MQSETGKKSKISLKGKQKKFLRGVGHRIDPAVYVGREGLSENLIKTARETFRTRELIKIKLGQNCSVSKKEAAARLSELTGAALVQLIGRTILLYLPSKKIKPAQRIILPKE